MALLRNLIQSGRAKPSGPPITAEQAEQDAEVIALNKFQENLASQRDFVKQDPRYRRTQRAPGFDYLNWRSYGTMTYKMSGEEEFERQAKALAPYVRAVLVSACEGAEEQRWKTLTTPVDTNPRPLGSRAESQNLLGSRHHSRDFS